MAIIKICKNESEIVNTYNTVHQLRPHLKNENEYVQTIQRLMCQHGYQLVAVIDDGQVKAVAGYRITESLAWGKYFYVDDLITDENSRKNGYAQKLWDWLLDEAKNNDCGQFHLDSGVNRFDAHRFYLKHGLDITCHHFQMNIK
jgi:GNAT superfamily N-acetyltransferase